MFAFVVLVILLVVGLFFLLFKRNLVVHDGSDDYHFPAWIPGLALTLLALVGLFFSTFNTVGAREVGIPVTFGHIGSDLQPGVHFLLPWTQIHSCTLAQQQSIQTQAPTQGDVGGNDGIPFAGSDQGSGTADTTVLYHFDRTHANAIYLKYGCNAALVKQNLIRQALKGAVPAATAKYASLDIKNNRPTIQADIEATLNADFAGDGIVVDDVILSQIDLSQATQDAANAKLAAQQAAQTANFHLAQAKIDAQTAAINGAAAKAQNNAQNASLTPAILCSQWIDAIKNGHVTVVNTAGPCAAFAGSGAAGTTASQTPVIVNAGG